MLPGDPAWTFPFTFPFDFGDIGTGGRTTITNNGNIPTKPIVDLYGPITSSFSTVQLINITTGKILQFLDTFELETGPFLRIDFQNETVFLNGSPDNNYIKYLDVANSEF